MFSCWNPLLLCCHNESFHQTNACISDSHTFSYNLGCWLTILTLTVCMEKQPSEASSCHSSGLIDEMIRENRSPLQFTHLPYASDLLLASIDTGTRGHQFNVLSKRHPAGIMLMKVHGKCWVLNPPRSHIRTKDLQCNRWEFISRSWSDHPWQLSES